MSLLYSAQKSSFDGLFYNSSFGFTASNIPKNWTIITKENSKSVLSPLLNQGLTQGLANNISLSTLKEVDKLINSGSYEVLIYKNNLGMLLVQSISNKKLSLDLKEKLFCGSLTDVLQKTYNRKNDTTVDYCNQKKIFGIDTISYKCDNLTIGFKTIGYSFNTSNEMISFSLICNNDVCEKLQQDTEIIFKNLKFKVTEKVTEKEVNDRIKELNNTLPNKFCSDSSFFINCFNTSKSNCLKVSKDSIYNCSQSNKNILYDAEKLKHAGEIIGRCAGENIVNIIGTYKNTNKCNAWLQQ